MKTKKDLSLIEKARKAFFENGPMTVYEAKDVIGRCGLEHLRTILNNNDDIFQIVGWLHRPGVQAQHIYGLIGVVQELNPEPKKAHPFDLPKHSIIYREMVKAQRVKYERY